MRQGSAIAVLGGGAWGTALAVTALRAGHEVRLWARDERIVASINDRHENSRYLPGITLDPGVRATSSLADALSGAELLLAVIPTQSLRPVLEQIPGLLDVPVPLLLCSKGIERGSGRLVSEVATEQLPQNPVAALSGPSFASDVARGLPTAVTVAAADGELAHRIASMLSTPQFRCYSTADLIGVEIGGALKNVMAIAAGVVAGAGLGASAQAAVVTRGFVELRRVGAAFGAEPETLMGLSGLGDLILSCGSAQSRNFAYGLRLGRGESVDGLPLAEGVYTTGIAAEIARERDIETPIIDAVDQILSGRLRVDEAVRALMSRPLKGETE